MTLSDWALAFSGPLFRNRLSLPSEGLRIRNVPIVKKLGQGWSFMDRRICVRVMIEIHLDPSRT
jgi:hypothetical protein